MFLQRPCTQDSGTWNWGSSCIGKGQYKMLSVRIRQDSIKEYRTLACKQQEVPSSLSPSPNLRVSAKHQTIC